MLRRGYRPLRLRLRHQQRPYGALVDAVRRLPRSVDPRLGRRDVICIDIASWPYPSVSTVPGRAMARFDLRFPPGDTVESLCRLVTDAAEDARRGWAERPALTVEPVLAEFTTYTGATFAIPEYAAAWCNDPDSSLVAGAGQALAAVGLDPTPMTYSFCTNGSYTAGELGIPTVGFGVGEEQVAHRAHEHVTLASLRAGEQGLASLALELAGR